MTFRYISTSTSDELFLTDIYPERRERIDTKLSILKDESIITFVESWYIRTLENGTEVKTVGNPIHRFQISEYKSNSRNFHVALRDVMKHPVYIYIKYKAWK